MTHRERQRGVVRLRRPKPRLDTPYKVAVMLTWEAHAGAVTSLAFVPGGGLLSTGVDGVVKHWDATTGSRLNTWKLAYAAENADDSNLLRVLSDATGRYAAVGLRTEGVRFFDLEDGREARSHFELSDTVGPVSAPDGASVFVVGRESRWFSRSTSQLFQYRYPPGKVIAVSKVAVSGPIVPNRDGSQILVGRERLRWPSGESGEPLNFYPSGQPHVVSADGDKLFGVNGTRLMVWGFQLGTFRRKITGHLDQITGLTNTPDGRKLWTASADATVRQWDVETYRCEKCYGLKVGPLGCVAVSPDGLTAAAGSRHNGKIAVWDLD
jgi:WD40 repeat protein